MLTHLEVLALPADADLSAIHTLCTMRYRFGYS